MMYIYIVDASSSLKTVMKKTQMERKATVLAVRQAHGLLILVHYRRTSLLGYVIPFQTTDDIGTPGQSGYRIAEFFVD